MKMRTIFRK